MQTIPIRSYLHFEFDKWQHNSMLSARVGNTQLFLLTITKWQYLTVGYTLHFRVLFQLAGVFRACEPSVKEIPFLTGLRSAPSEGRFCLLNKRNNVFSC